MPGGAGLMEYLALVALVIGAVVYLLLADVTIRLVSRLMGWDE